MTLLLLSTSVHMQLSAEHSPAGTSSTAVADRETSAVSQEDLEDTVLHNTNQFYKWHAELEAAFTSETEEKYRQYAAELQGRVQQCTEIHDKAGTSLPMQCCSHAIPH